MKTFPPDVAARHLATGWWDGTTWDTRARASATRRAGALALVDPPNRRAFTDGDPRELTWSEVDVAVDRLAAQLLAAGLGAGDVIAVQLPNVHELAVSFLAIARIGAVITPLPIQYREHELLTLVGKARAKGFITAANIAGRQNAAAVLAIAAQLPDLRVVAAFGDSVPDGAVDLGSDPRPTDEAALDAYVAELVIDPNDAVTICWTSGTESTPKGVVRCHGDWSAVLWTTIDSPGLTADDVLLCTFPMVNAGGVGGMFAPWITVGCTLVLHQPFDLEIFLDQVEQRKITYTVSPPAVLTKLLLDPALLDGRDLSSLRCVGSGSAPLSPFLIEGWEARGVEVINYFGSNEGLSLVGDRSTIPDPAERAFFFPNFSAPGFDWRVRTAKDTRVRIVDLESGVDISEPGRPGELRLTGPSVFAGYLDGEGDPFDEHGYYRSGDVFEYVGDDLRLLRYVDRAKDLIIRGGQNISPAEIEGLAQSHTKVAEVAAIGWPDDVLGERVALVVVPRDPSDPPTKDELIAHFAAQQVAKFKWPERLDCVPELPRNPVGKILKRELRARVQFTRNGR